MAAAAAIKKRGAVLLVVTYHPQAREAEVAVDPRAETMLLLKMED